MARHGATRISIGLAAALLSLGAGSGRADAQPADLVVINAHVVTLDATSRIAQAAAIRGGRFAAVGTDAEIRAMVGPQTRVIDAGGRTVVPGLIDSHVHALGVASAEATSPFRNLRSVAEIQDWVRDTASRTPPGKWIWTPRVFPTRVRERRFPTREELDRASPAHPVVVDGAYALMLNTAALKTAGITAGTPDPPGGAIVRASGEATGLLRNVGAMLARFRPEAGAVPPLDQLERVHREYNKVGITSVIERLATVEGFRVYERLKREQRLNIRATITIQLPPLPDADAVRHFITELPLKPREGDEWLKAGALKIVADGGILAGTSFMRRPFGLASRPLYGVDDPAYHGFLSLTLAQIDDAFSVGHALGWQMAAHVTGDAGVDAVLDAIERAQAGATDRRHTLIHAYFPDPAVAARAARLGVMVDTQPAWLYKDADALTPALGSERLQHFIGLRTWLDAGVHTAINTDHMFGLDSNEAMNPFNPFLTMSVAITRKTEGGAVVGAGEAVTREQALRMMTVEAARLSFDESSRGSIEAGKLGDFVMLSDDLMTCPVDRIRHITALMTVVGGRVVHNVL